MSQAEIIDITTRRSLLRAIVAAPAIAPRSIPLNPDRELIDVCARMHTINFQLADLFEHDYDQDTIEELREPLTDAWFTVAKRMFKLRPPSTEAGAKAVALALLANLPAESFEMATQDEDPVQWLAIGLARFVLGTA